MTGIRLSIRACSLSDDLRTAADLSRRLGYQGLTLESVSAQLDFTQLSVSARRDIKHLLTRSQQELVALRSQLPVKGLLGDLDKVLWHIQRHTKAAADMNCNLLLLDAGRILEPPRVASARPKVAPKQAGPIIIPTGYDVDVPDESHYQPQDPTLLPAWLQIDQAMREIGKLADQYGVRLAIASDLSSHAAIQRAVRQAACPWIGTDLDPVAMLRDSWTPEKILSELGDTIFHIRGRDALLGTGSRTQLTSISRGNVQWQQLFALLDQGAFHGWLTIDTMDLPDRTAEAGRAIMLLHKMLIPH